MITPGCHDALGTRIIEEAGFSLAYTAGKRGSTRLTGMPEGLLTMTEMADQARCIASALTTQLIR